MLKNYGRKDIVVTTDDHLKQLSENEHYFVMTLDEVKWLLLGVYPHRSESCSPKELFKSPIQAPRWWSHLSSAEHFHAGPYYMVCVPTADYEQNFIKQVVPEALRQQERELLLSSAWSPSEAYGGLELYKFINRKSWSSTSTGPRSPKASTTDGSAGLS